MKVIVFDTETSGLPDQNQITDKLLLDPNLLCLWDALLPKWTHILQLAYIIYDTDANKVVKIYNKYVDIGAEVVINPNAFKIHHINHDSINHAPNKAPIKEVLEEFMKDFYASGICVGHNVLFDRKMIIAELIRNNFSIEDITSMMNNNLFRCTMNDTKTKCNIQIPVNYMSKSGKPISFFKVKSPKLLEAHKFFFGYEPRGDMLHDALTDVVVCLRIFMIHSFDIDIYFYDKLLEEYIVRFSPEYYLLPNVPFTLNEIVDPLTEDVEFM